MKYAKRKGKSLSTKIAWIITMVLLGFFAILITVSTTQIKNRLESASIRELEELSRLHALGAENIFSSSQQMSEEIVPYIEKAYQENWLEDAQTARGATKNSQIYPELTMTPEQREVENYLVNATALTVQNDSNEIVGIGVYMEPYAISEKRESYAFYMEMVNNQPTFSDIGEYSSYSKKTFYTDAMQKDDLVYSEPYNDPVTGKLIITAATPIHYQGKKMGIVLVDISLEKFQEVSETREHYPSLHTLIATDRDVIVYSSNDTGALGASLSSIFQKDADYQKVTEQIRAHEEFYIQTRDADGVPVYRFFAPILVGNDVWMVSDAVSVRDVLFSALTALLVQAGIAVVALIIISVTVVVVLKKKLRPIRYVVDAANQIARGELDVQLNIQSHDELGDLSNSFSNTCQYLKTMIGEISRVLDCIAHNDLKATTELEYIGDFSSIKHSLDDILRNLNRVMCNINRSADDVAYSSEQIASNAQAMAQGATEQAGSLTGLADTITSISEQITNTAGHASSAKDQVILMGEEVLVSNQKMGQMIDAMNEIESSSKEIEKIIKTIEDIAFQTNILALNAAVEAARAGTAGKGFAVVADEVRNLASKSAEAVQNTTNLIAHSIQSVENGTKIADETAQSLQTVVSGTKEIEDVISKIADASQEQSQAVQEISQGIDQISSVVQTNSATSEESAAASHELSGQARTLKNLVGEFQLRDCRIPERSTQRHPGQKAPRQLPPARRDVPRPPSKY